MDENEAENKRLLKVAFDRDSQSAVNSLILDYYQKFGRKRDLEHFFALSTAQSDIRDPTNLFWRKMKVQSDSSDSGEGKAGSSTELCRISIKCTLPEDSPSQDDNLQSNVESTSPPIITEEAVSSTQTEERSPSHSDNEFIKSDGNNSQKSTEVHLDTSTNKPFSPTSSINSQRKLEWDSLGDVGYANESERKPSGSNLSTLERLALHQQYSNNDSKHDTQFGLPLSQSTPDEPNISQKGKRGNIKKTTKIYKKDVDFVEFNVPHTSENTRSINVNLTKHISFNVDNNGDFTVNNSKEDMKQSLGKVSVETEMTPQMRIDKEIQTSLTKSEIKRDQSTNSLKVEENQLVCEQKFPIILNLNALKKRKRRRKLRMFKKKLNKPRSKLTNLLPVKSVNQISDAESFEYMPGHVYNQNKRKTNNDKNSSSAGNKSSLESTLFTTDSSKVSKNSFNRDLEKSITLLKDALHPNYNSSKLKEKLVKEVVQRLLKAKYSDDDSGNVFLSGLRFDRKKIKVPQSSHTTTSTSDGNNCTNSDIVKRPKKSILRVDKFNPNGMASTSQSTPNLHSYVQNEEQVNTHEIPSISNTESDVSSRERNSSDTVLKMSSQELYKKYLNALKREQAQKKLLKDKETLLKKKLVSSDTCIRAIAEKNEKSKDRLHRLIKDLAQNNVDNGSGDAGKLEGRSNSDQDQYSSVRTQRNHSVFTLLSGKPGPNSGHGSPKKHRNVKKGSSEASSSKVVDNCSVCSQRSEYLKTAEGQLHNNGNKEGIGIQNNNFGKTKGEHNSDSTKDFAKCNKTSPRITDKIGESAEDVQYVCVCSKEAMDGKDVPEKLLIYKCSRINQQNVCLDSLSKASSSVGIQCSSECVCLKQRKDMKSPMTTLPVNSCSNKELLHEQCSSTVICPSRKASTSSQTHANLDLILQRESSSSESTIMSKITCQPAIMKDYIKLDNQEHKTSECSSRVCDVTQSVQTRICIDPRISNPSISDVKFIDDLNLGKTLDHSKYDSSTCKKNAESCGAMGYGDFRNPQSDKGKIKTVPNVEQNPAETCMKCSNDNNSKPIEIMNTQFPNENKFSIPIHGTNMTLIVSLGSTENTTDLRNVITGAKYSVTTKPNSLNKNTESIEDSIKCVQCTSKDFSSLINKKIDENISDINKDFRCGRQSANKGPVDSKYNTYPTKPQTTKKFVRSNTCTGYLESCCSNVSIDKKLDVIQKDAPTNLTSKSKESIDYDCCQKSLHDNNICKTNDVQRNDQGLNSKTSSTESKDNIEDTSKDPILKIIQDITKRYTKKDIEKSKRKKCYRDIITVLNYLLDTEESSDQKECQSSSCNTEGTSLTNKSDDKKTASTKKLCVDKAVQLTMKKDKKHTLCTESSNLPSSSEKPDTSDSGTCKVLNKIRRECEKYHQKRCKVQCEHKNCNESSSTSVNCGNCNRVHYCSVRSKHKTNKTKSNIDKGKKKCVAYNLIIQTSDSLTSEGTAANEGCGRPLKNVIVKVPSKHEHLCNAPFKEVSAKIEKKLPDYSPCCEGKVHRSKSLPNDSERSSDDLSKTMGTCTVRDYLEMNRPDFIEKTMKRQNCLKVIKQTRTNERTTKQRLLSQQLERQQTLNNLNSQDFQHLAKELSAQLRRKKVAPKFISEPEMKKHSEKIYKSLPEVVEKKEKLKKENIKKTNLLMANIFKKNLQMKTLRGSINLSNYSTVVKI